MFAKTLYDGDASPWGEADDVLKISDGIYDVQTSSHGGIMIDADSEFVQSCLSPAALEVADLYDGWLCFEEDTAYAVAMWEIIYNDFVLDWSYEYYEQDPEHYEWAIKNTILKYYPEYAEAKGIE